MLKPTIKCTLPEGIHYDKAILLVVVDADGRSFSGWTGPDSEFAGTAVLYSGVEEKLQTGVIAHEIMHLLGAKDLYVPYQSDDVARFIEENYPNEIMFQDNMIAPWSNSRSAHTLSGRLVGQLKQRIGSIVLLNVHE